MRSVLQTIAVAALFGFSSALLIADDEPVIEVDPVGEPKNLSKGNALRYFLWVDAEGWHVRTDTAGKAHDFNGVIDVVEGKVTSISEFQSLEVGKKKKKSDVGILNKARNQITFKFHTKKQRDGFSFQLDDAATEVRFRLLIDGKPQPNRIIIGAAAQQAPSEVLVFPARAE